MNTQAVRDRNARKRAKLRAKKRGDEKLENLCIHAVEIRDRAYFARKALASAGLRVAKTSKIYYDENGLRDYSKDSPRPFPQYYYNVEWGNTRLDKVRWTQETEFEQGCNSLQLLPNVTLQRLIINSDWNSVQAQLEVKLEQLLEEIHTSRKRTGSPNPGLPPRIDICAQVFGQGRVQRRQRWQGIVTNARAVAADVIAAMVATQDL